MASSTQSDTIELQQLPAPNPKSEPIRDANDAASTSQGSSSPPDTAVPVVEKWNSNRTNTYRLLATFWGFLVMGGNDAAYGVRLQFALNHFNGLTANSE